MILKHRIDDKELKTTGVIIKSENKKRERPRDREREDAAPNKIKLETDTKAESLNISKLQRKRNFVSHQGGRRRKKRREGEVMCTLNLSLLGFF